MNMNNIQQDMTKARDNLLDVQQTVGERTLDVARKNANAFMDLFSEGLSARTADDAKNFLSTFARVTRESLENGVELFQANARDLTKYGQEAGETVKNNVEKAVKTVKEQAKKRA